MNGLVLYDQYCGLCNWWVTLLFRIDKSGKITFTPLDSAIGDKIITRANIHADSVVYYKNNKAFIKSDAIIRVLRDLGGFWKFFAILLRFIPQGILDTIYDFIAKKRSKWFPGIVAPNRSFVCKPVSKLQHK